MAAKGRTAVQSMACGMSHHHLSRHSVAMAAMDDERWPLQVAGLSDVSRALAADNLLGTYNHHFHFSQLDSWLYSGCPVWDTSQWWLEIRVLCRNGNRECNRRPAKEFNFVNITQEGKMEGLTCRMYRTLQILLDVSSVGGIGGMTNAVRCESKVYEWDEPISVFSQIVMFSDIVQLLLAYVK